MSRPNATTKVTERTGTIERGQKVASLGGILLQNQSSIAGAAFRLSKVPTFSATVAVVDGAEIQVTDRNPYVVVRMTATPEKDVITQAHLAAQLGLDWLSVTGRADLATQNVEDEHVLWWKRETHHIIRIVETFSLAFTASSPTVSIDGQQSEVDDSLIIATSDHPGFRYYRLAQLTDDLYDAYRNMYLAFELTLSRAYPKQPSEREFDWLRRGLTDAEAKLDLVNRTKVSDVDEFLRRIYGDARLPLFHAKYDRDYYSPHSIEHSRQAVVTALATLTPVVLKMFEVWHLARRRRSMVYPASVHRSIVKQWAAAQVIVSNHESFDAASTDAQKDEFNDGVPMDDVNAKETPDGRPVLVGVVAASKLADLPAIRRFHIANDVAPLMTHVMEAPLDLDGMTHCEFNARIRVVNNNQPRRTFRV